jgi:hypothetical protein
VLSPPTGELLREIIQANLIEEVKATMTDADDFKAWLDAINDKSIRISNENKPKIEPSYDMAWQQKGSGHVYNSMSGHGTFIGRHSRKVIALLVMKSKTCSTCVAWRRSMATWIHRHINAGRIMKGLPDQWSRQVALSLLLNCLTRAM